MHLKNFNLNYIVGVSGPDPAVARRDYRLDEIYYITYGNYPTQEEEYIVWLEVLLNEARKKKSAVA